MRIPYVPDPPPTSTPEEASLVEAIKARRHPRPLQPLDLTLLHAPPLASGWNSFIGAIRGSTTVTGPIRELSICRIAVLNQAWYEWRAHSPLAVKDGATDEVLDALKVDEFGSERPACLSEELWAVLLYTDEMTKNVTVKDETFDRLRKHFNERQIVEITLTIASYNCVSRFLVAMNIGEMNGVGLDAVSQSHKQ